MIIIASSAFAQPLLVKLASYTLLVIVHWYRTLTYLGLRRGLWFGRSPFDVFLSLQWTLEVEKMMCSEIREIFSKSIYGVPNSGKESLLKASRPLTEVWTVQSNLCF